MTNEDIKLYDIIKEWGAAGLGFVLKHFHEEREACCEELRADYCMEDIYWHTQMLTHRELKDMFPNEKDYFVLLKNDAYILVETF